MLVAGRGARAGAARLLRRGARRASATAARPSCCGIDVSFGDADQVFHVGPASCGVYGTPAGVCEAARAGAPSRSSELAAPAAQLAREGVVLNAGQAYVAEILAELLSSTPECAALWAPDGRVLREGERLRNPDLGEALERLGARGPRAVLPRRHRGRGVRLAARARRLAHARGPRRLRRRRARAGAASATATATILTNPPPSAGGTLLAYSLALLDRGPAPPTLRGVVEAMAAAQSERTPEFVEGLDRTGLPRALPRLAARLDDAHLGDRRRRPRVQRDVHQRRGLGRGRARHRDPPQQHDGRGGPQPARLAPAPRGTAAAEHDGPDGGAARRRGRARARQRRLEPHPLRAPADDRRRRRPRPRRPRGGRRRRACTSRTASCSPSPGSTSAALARELRVVRFHALNLFFGGVQAALRRDGLLSGAGDPRRGGVAVSA